MSQQPQQPGKILEELKKARRAYINCNTGEAIKIVDDLIFSLEDLSAPASPVEEKREGIVYPDDIPEWISSEMAEYSDNENHQISFYDGFEATYKKLTESKPSPVILQRAEEAIAFAKWINNSWYTPHYSKWIHLREGLAGMKTVEELWELFQQSKQNKDGK